ncbi:MAG: hypothetical protein A2095_08340 [Sphingomonadales bacterium GWF1_63_6]|nr:MAG: hypothetical protein A2095_08340 [Sphingomonadales bacterium GWF1_63_6]
MNDKSAEKRLRAALDRLTMAQRIAYLLSATDDLHYEAIAFRMGVTVDEAKRHLAEALSNLTRLMDDP